MINILLNFSKKFVIINSNVCPAIILALNRIAKLPALKTYENNSIGIKISNNKTGASGIKSLKNWTPNL